MLRLSACRLPDRQDPLPGVPATMIHRKQTVYLNGRKFIRDVQDHPDGTGRVLLFRQVWLAVLNYPNRAYWTAIRATTHVL